MHRSVPAEFRSTSAETSLDLGTPELFLSNVPRVNPQLHVARLAGSSICDHDFAEFGGDCSELWWTWFTFHSGQLVNVSPR